MELQAVRIDATDPAAPKVEVAGVDVSDSIESAALVIRPGQLPRLILEVNMAGGGEGLAGIVAMDASGLPAIKEWLDSLDPGEVEGAALELLGSFDREIEVETTGQAFIAALKALAP